MRKPNKGSSYSQKFFIFVGLYFFSVILLSFYLSWILFPDFELWNKIFLQIMLILVFASFFGIYILRKNYLKTYTIFKEKNRTAGYIVIFSLILLSTIVLVYICL
jgi:hypothetical protein